MVRAVLLIAVSLAFVTNNSLSASAQEATSFTVADDIGMTVFNDRDGFPPELHFSPDGQYFAVWSERGNLALNHVEDSITFYRTADVQRFVQDSDSPPPLPAWVLTCSNTRGRVIDHWRWLTDSSGVAFLQRSGAEDQRLEFADLGKKAVEQLTGESERVDTYDISDKDHYVYLAWDETEVAKDRQADSQSPAVVGTGKSIFELLFPNDSRWIPFDRKSLWAVADGRRWRVKRNGEAVNLGSDFALSPDGSTLATELPVADVPSSWEKLYPPPYGAAPEKHIQAGAKDVKQYVLFNLESGSVEPLTDAPTGDAAGWWWGGEGASWSSDGREVLLPGTFLKSKENVPSRPCVAVVDIATKTGTCIEVLKARTNTTREDGYHLIVRADFEEGDQQRVVVHFLKRSFLAETAYQRVRDGSWKNLGNLSAGSAELEGLKARVQQGLNDPPRLVVSDQNRSRVLWDPNPQIKNIKLGETTIFRWKDKKGQTLEGGLYKPVNYQPGVRYPLVIQTHGFNESEFIPSGIFPTAFAARELASAGIMVLQAEDNAPGCSAPSTPEEGPCAVSAFQSAAEQLVSDGLVDPKKIGIIGFSRSCYYVMQTLTTSSLQLAAASINDGVTGDYLNYILAGGADADLLNGSKPFGQGLQQWLKSSPGFNLEKINTPLLITGAGPSSVLFMWQSYAGLHYLKKPVDLIMLNSNEHVLTNPAVRMASQSGSVDWFRFWLQGYEDPDPVKTEQYRRWRELKKLQSENEKKASTSSAAPN